METFQDTPISGSSKVWVKAGTYDAGARSKVINNELKIMNQNIVLEEDTKDKGKLYKPTSRLSSTHESSSSDRAQAYAKLVSSDKKPERLGKKKHGTKSNLETFMEELRQ